MIQKINLLILMMKILSWDDFNYCIHAITRACKGKQFSGVYGFPRGGLCLAVAMSHALNIDYLQELKPGCLAIDDVYEKIKNICYSGMTYRKDIGQKGLK